MLLPTGLKTTDLKIIETPAPEQALIKGTIDAALGLEMNQPLLLSLRGTPIKIIGSYRNFTNFYGSLFISNKTFIQNNKELLSTFISVAQRGWDYAQNNPLKAAEIIVDHYLSKENASFNDRNKNIEHQYKHLLISLFHRTNGVGRENVGDFSLSRMQTGMDVLQKTGLLKKSVTPQECYTTDVLDLWKQSKDRVGGVL